MAHGAVAIGECGLDYHYDHSPRERQLAAFAAQLALAPETPASVVVHTREAEDDTRAMVARPGGRRRRRAALLHRAASLAEAALDVGWYVSFSGIVTFKKWTDDALIRVVPDDRLLVESDAPYLAPVPHRENATSPRGSASPSLASRRCAASCSRARRAHGGQRATALRVGVARPG